MTGPQVMAVAVLVAVVLLLAALLVTGRRHPQSSARQPVASDDSAAPARHRAGTHPAPRMAQPSADPPRPFASDNGLIIGSAERREP